MIKKNYNEKIKYTVYGGKAITEAKKGCYYFAGSGHYYYITGKAIKEQFIEYQMQYHGDMRPKELKSAFGTSRLRKVGRQGMIKGDKFYKARPMSYTGTMHFVGREMVIPLSWIARYNSNHKKLNLKEVKEGGW